MPSPLLFSAPLATLAQADQLRTRRIVESAQGSRLTIDGRDYLAFASNDYLGLANNPRLMAAAKKSIDRYGIGAGASHMVSGHMTPHHELEIALARFMSMDSALYFGSGYAANLGMLTSLAARGDNIFADKLNHACLNDGALLSNANFHRYAHGDLGKLRSQLAISAKNSSNTPRNIVVTDSVFSMDGDIADLPQLLKIAEEFDALLVIDDAHGFGVLGKTGRGSLEHFGIQSDRIIYMATLGKAAGVYGAFVAGQRDVIEWILQTARTYIFSTATPPMMAAALIESLKIIDEDSARRTHLHELIHFFTLSLKLKNELKNCTLNFSKTAIQPIIVGENNRALYFADELKKRGIWVPAIRPPTVPAGTARLRVSLNAGHTKADVIELIAALTEIDASLPSRKT